VFRRTNYGGGEPIPPNIPGAKRAGLVVDFDRLTSEGDSWLSPEERYSLKTYGVCAQAQPGVFMIRNRTNGSIDADVARGLADIADVFAKGWLHLTTRQQVQFHHVHATDVTTVQERVRELGLTNRSACGHTMRGVMSCPLAGVGLEEPFDCSVDARAVTQSILARQPELDTKMPQRINIAFGGCPECREHAKVNDLGFVSKINEEAELGYEVWIGGSLGKSSPTLAFKALDFIPRADVLPATHALFELFTTYGAFDQPAKARLKYLIKQLGQDVFMDLYLGMFEEAKSRPWPAPAPLSTPLSAALGSILACAPEGGWSTGIRPQRIPGYALVTVHVPLGDLDSRDFRLLANLAEDHADGRLYLTRNQNIMFRHVHLGEIEAMKAQLAEMNLSLEGADSAQDVRTCTGGPVCSLALTPAPNVGAELLRHPALLRNSALRVHISGCPNACAQHQIGDIGFSGSKVTITGATMLGYQVWLGGDLARDEIAQVVGRVAEDDVYAITGAIVGIWEALREKGETLTDTVRRMGVDVFAAQIAAVFKGQWEPGEEPAETPVLPAVPRSRLLKMVVVA
jgi:sulfite reductase beta subunit-like hemoprotein